MAVAILIIAWPFFIIPREIRELNENTNLPFKFAEPLKKYNFEGNDWQKEDIYYKVYYTNQKEDRLGFYGYPDLSNEFKFTYYRTYYNQETSVFGFHIGDKAIEVDRILKKDGYKQLNENDPEEYEKGRVKIWLSTKTIYIDGKTTEEVNIIDSILIFLDTTDWLRKGNYK